MKLSDLIEKTEVKKIIGNIENIEISAIYDNSKKVKKDGLFVAISGLQVDSHAFILEAKNNGAVAVVVEKECDINIPQIIVENTRIVLSKLAGFFYKDVLSKLKIISVIGTNGKTTTTHFIKEILLKVGFKVGVIGTSGIFIHNKKLPNKLTTPDTLDLFLIFEEMVKEKIEVVVMEISAHAIFLHKTDGFISDIAVFTNISPEHLDFFSSMKEYEKVKASYFTNEFCKTAVINADDKLGKKLLKIKDIPVFSYSLNSNSTLFLKNLKISLNKSAFTLFLKNNKKRISVNIPSLFNIYNLLAATLTCVILKVSFEKLITILPKLKLTNGRFKTIKIDENCSVVIDYAHTTLAVKSVLSHIKNSFFGNIVCVLGSPGSRDHFKRYEMAKVAGEYCSNVIITSDNPDIENPYIIFKQMQKGIKKTKCNYQIVEDRALSIKHAILNKKNDEKTIIVILGKGNETYQIINGICVPYNDEEEVKKIIKRRNI